MAGSEHELYLAVATREPDISHWTYSPRHLPLGQFPHTDVSPALFCRHRTFPLLSALPMTVTLHYSTDFLMWPNRNCCQIYIIFGL